MKFSLEAVNKGTSKAKGLSLEASLSGLCVNGTTRCWRFSNSRPRKNH
jgi:hypothetical protein